ncbi:MAG TPA: hypothetical protein VII58_03540 [Acidobacteriaceae bacterium]
MAQPLPLPRSASTPSATIAPSSTLFGIPFGGLGWFGSLLIAVAAGFMSFFATTFCAIVVILIANSASHTSIDFAVSYRDVGLPVGLVVLVAALGYLGTLWVRRVLRKA